jgi:hypothetical protein
MANLFNQFLSGISSTDEIRDYQHAAKTFVDGLYRLSPKLNSLFHVFIELNPAVAKEDPQNPNNLYELGLLAKTVQLPKFSIQNKTLNAYNRKNIVQERISYDPVNMTFHDDNADVVRNFWEGYYSYYYRDSDHSSSLYQQEHKYVERQAQNWGFTPRYIGPGTPNYINAIRIYSLHQKSFSSYILFRPTITGFEHGQHVQGEYSPLENSVTFAYEAVQYEYGAVREGSVLGFNIMHYDTTPSPLTSLGGGTTSILGPGGAVSGAGDVINNLQNGNFGAAAVGSLNMFSNFKNTSLTAVASGELKQTAINILRGQNNQSSIFVPTSASVKEGLSKSIFGKPTAAAGGLPNINSQASKLPNVNSLVLTKPEF